MHFAARGRTPSLARLRVVKQKSLRRAEGRRTLRVPGEGVSGVDPWPVKSKVTSRVFVRYQVRGESSGSKIRRGYVSEAPVESPLVTSIFPTSDRTRVPAEFKHINKRRKRN